MDSINKLINIISNIPGLGPKSSRRCVLHLLNKRDFMGSLTLALTDVLNNVKHCKQCFNFTNRMESLCNICMDSTRKKNIICVVETVADLWSLEQGKMFDGQYYVLGGRLSAVEGVTPDDLNIKDLEQRVIKDKPEEVIIATNFTLEGKTTGIYIAEIMRKHTVNVSVLAHGLPVGGEIDYMDIATLEFAMRGRKRYDDGLLD
ncbi:MAG: recombination protein RecR [Candidatus Xenolissoclinum pacificiensis L6]|uniref:Recombination protein RecR n=1 Tax=Candidatus Xenolissoclinum pacificiensis L6 TaxID=1401685 RepID=W2V0Q2_9RICK|nr:MAG: recombination protein RecR [Candidatus Xenolissoclinum pacificiensis L6]